MKTFNGLFQRMVEPSEIRVAIKETLVGKSNREEAKPLKENPDKEIEKLRRELIEETWEPPEHALSEITEGSKKKTRLVEKPHLNNEQIVHHLIIRRLMPILTPRFYKYSMGSVPGRGSLMALRTMSRWRDEYQGKRFYVAELDIRKFYQSIPREKLKESLRRLIRDQKFLRLVDKVVDGAITPGMPMGYYTSPWLTNWYLTPLDNHINQELKPKHKIDHYLRYADNLWLLGRNKREMHKAVADIEKELEKLGLQLNESRQVFLFEEISRRTGKLHGRAINCLGYIIHRDRVTLRKALLQRIRKAGNRVGKRKHPTLRQARTIVSYKGWFKHTDTYNYYQKWMKPNVSMQECRKKISEDAKRRNKQ